MTEKKEETYRRQHEDLKIHWFGIDGLLCLIYIAEAVVFGWAMVNNNDFIIGKFVPYTVAVVTTAVFLKYITQVLGFAVKNKNRP